MINDQLLLGIADELIVDLFAGGGGASCGIERAVGRHVDIAVNHSPNAISMHEANHPQTKHYCCDVWEVDPVEVVGGRRVGLLHASPDCTHHSQARGGQPRSKKIRALAWVVHRWVGKLRKRGLGPRRVTLENVEQMLHWSPLIAKRCPTTGRVIKLDGTIAKKGERTPLEQQFLVPDPKRKGKTWRQFVEGLRNMGGAVQWRKMSADDYGAFTSRERLFMVAGYDGRPIIWPEPTHAKKPKRGQKRKGTAADIIDFSLPCPSIFKRERPLAEATLRRIARGVRKYVLDCADPFIVPLRGTSAAHTSAHSINSPLGVVSAGGTHHALVTPTLIQSGYGERKGQAPRTLDLHEPLGTVMAEGVKHALVAPTLMPLTHQGFDRVNDPAEPLPTITGANRGEMALAAATLVQFRFDRDGLPMSGPIPTITAGGASKRPGGNNTLGMAVAFMAQHNAGKVGHSMNDPVSTIMTDGVRQGVVECSLSQEHEEGALQVAAFLMRYYGQGGQDGDLREPASTITTKDRLALVTVTIKGTPYVIVDIGLRMLQPHELYAAQGFPSDYIIDRGADGRKFSKSDQVKMCGNSVSPPPMEALIRANYSDAMQVAEAA